MFEIVDEQESHDEACLRRAIDAARHCTCGLQDDDRNLVDPRLVMFACGVFGLAALVLIAVINWS